MGYDFPTLALLSGFSAGDAGIPNGGRTGITPTSNDTTVGGVNDYRTYYSYTGNGLGELNTGRWVMGWIARATWEGEGPYYYAPSSASTVSFDIDRNGSDETCYVYRRPDGRIYALVYKPDPGNSATWQYMYPYDGGNDVIDPEDPYGAGSAYRQRENRYKASWHTDYYLLKSDYVNYDDDANHAPTGWTGHYSPASVVGTTGLNRFKMYSLNGTTGRGQYGDDLDASTSQCGMSLVLGKDRRGERGTGLCQPGRGDVPELPVACSREEVRVYHAHAFVPGIVASACGMNFNINVDALVFA